mgnify:CR=1 FL=1
MLSGMQPEPNSPISDGSSHNHGTPNAVLPLLQCEVTHVLIGAYLEDAQRYAETIASRLEAAIEALEALGAVRRVTLMRGWLERWLRITEQLFEQRLEERQTLFGTQA